jgi:cytochrome c oxidase subunit 2
LLALAAGAAPAHAQDAAGQKLYAQCTMCHGASGEGNEEQHAPRIAGLPEWYVTRQLRAFRTRVRGGDEEADPYGAQMARMALQLWDDGEVTTVARYVAALPAGAPNRSARGKAKNGEALFVACAACHGTKAEGNPDTGAPPLARHDDWYLMAQLNAFRAGARGTHETDTFGQQMRAAAALLTDDAQVQDVVSHIATLGEPAPRSSSRRRD